MTNTVSIFTKWRNRCTRKAGGNLEKSDEKNGTTWLQSYARKRSNQAEEGNLAKLNG